jgi:hypothetical protein
MPKIIVTHDVSDVAHWLASPKREEVFAGVASNITTFVMPGDGKKVAVALDITSMEDFEAVIRSDAGAAAMTYDGVLPETVAVYLPG